LCVGVGLGGGLEAVGALEALGTLGAATILAGTVVESEDVHPDTAKTNAPTQRRDRISTTTG
jgi:hypothetical protein